MLYFSGRQIGTNAHACLGDEGALRSRTGLVSEKCAADGRQSASSQSASAEQRANRLFQRRRQADLGDGVGTVSGTVSRRRSLPPFRFPSRRVATRGNKTTS